MNAPPLEHAFRASLAVTVAWLLGVSVIFPSSTADYVAWPSAFVTLVLLARRGQLPQSWTARLSQLAIEHPVRLGALLASWFVISTSARAFATFGDYRTGLDLGIFDQLAYMLAEHHSFVVSLTERPSYLATHFSPVLAVLGVVHTIAGDPRVLIGLQIVAVAASVIPVTLLARRLVERTDVALVIGGLYLFSLSVRRLATFDFHPQAFVPLVLGFALLAIAEQRWVRAGVLALLLISIKESTLLGCAGLGFVMIAAQRRYRAGGAVVAASLVAFVVVMKLVVPHFGDGRSYAFVERYSHLGGGIGEIVVNLVTKPYLAGYLFYPSSKLEYLVRLLLPLAFLPILGWRWTIGALLVWAQNALSRTYPMHSVRFQYVAEMMPFLFAGAAAGWARLPHNRRGPALMCACMLTLFMSEKTDISYALRGRDLARKARIEAAIARVPRDACVVADDHLLAHLSHRTCLNSSSGGARSGAWRVYEDGRVEPPAAATE